MAGRDDLGKPGVKTAEHLYLHGSLRSWGCVLKLRVRCAIYSDSGDRT